MVHCVAFGCSNGEKATKERGVSFHRFPRNDETRRKWVVALKLNKLLPHYRTIGLVTSARRTSVKRTTSGTGRPSCLGQRNAVFSRKVLSRPCLCFGQRSTEKLPAKQESVQG